MNTLNAGDLVQVSGGLIGGGSTPSGIPLLDADATRIPGQNSYGEWTPGGAAHFGAVLAAGEAQIARDLAVAIQVRDCLNGMDLACLLSTLNALSAIEATVVRTPHIRGPQGK